MPCGFSSRKNRESEAANTSIRNAVKFKTVRIFKSKTKERNIIIELDRKERRGLCNLYWGW